MRVIHIVIACAGLSGVALGQTSRPTTGPAAVAELIRQLSSDDWKARQSAQDKLVALGQEAAGALRELRAKTTEDEVRTRAEAALRQIAQEDLTEPTRVTLQAKDRPGDDVLGELCRQAGVEIDGPPGHRGNHVSVNFKGEPFWLAAKETCRQAGFKPMEIYGRRVAFPPDDSGWGAAPAVWSQNVLVVAGCTKRERLAQLGTGKVARRAYIQFDVHGDPKGECQMKNIRLQEVKDDKGNSLLAPKRQDGDDYFERPSSQGDHWVTIKDIGTGGDRIAVVNGEVDAVLYKYDDWEFANPVGVKDQVRTTSAGQYTIVTVQESGRDACSVELQIHNPIHREMGREPEPDLQDGNGKSWNRNGGSYSEGKNGEFLITRTFDRPKGVGDPAKLVWRIVVKKREVSVPFEFKDLPLP